MFEEEGTILDKAKNTPTNPYGNDISNSSFDNCKTYFQM